MGSKRTFRDGGSVSFKEPCVTRIRYFEPDEVKSYTATVLDKIRFDKYIGETKAVLLPVLERKILHLETCKFKDHYKCKFHRVLCSARDKDLGQDKVSLLSLDTYKEPIREQCSQI